MQTVGDWYKDLPGWKKVLFKFLCLFGETNAIEWVGYHRDTKNK